MSKSNPASQWGFVAVMLWLLLLLIFIDITVGSFVVPAMVPHWKAEGLKEAPVPWQQIVDSADYIKFHPLIVFPPLLIGAVVTTFVAVGARIWALLKRCFGRQ